MNVRSALLTVYETHFVPLGPRLRPGLNGFLSGILAGLEEGSDHLERYIHLKEADVHAFSRKNRKTWENSVKLLSFVMEIKWEDGN